MLLLFFALSWCSPLPAQYMARFVDDESKSKRGGRGMDVSHWPSFNHANVPRQRNGLDCGKPVYLIACPVLQVGSTRFAVRGVVAGSFT